MPEIEQFTTQKAKVRLDIWLWAARFFKTRSLCKQAIDGGKIEVNSNKGKTAKLIAVDDEITISRGQQKIVVVVQLLSEKRGPATIASKLYQETEESIATREKQAEIRQINQASHNPPQRRPDKKQRRQIHRFKQQY